MRSICSFSQELTIKSSIDSDVVVEIVVEVVVVVVLKIGFWTTEFGRHSTLRPGSMSSWPRVECCHFSPTLYGQVLLLKAMIPTRRPPGEAPIAQACPWARKRYS